MISDVIRFGKEAPRVLEPSENHKASAERNFQRHQGIRYWSVLHILHVSSLPMVPTHATHAPFVTAPCHKL
eukprot:scaffold184631_cov18-Tisochrysis_lutea.AAC.2